MKKILLSSLFIISSISLFSQKKIELFDLIKALAESQGSDAGDWAVGKPAMYPVKWKEDRVTMSEDTAINFFRQGYADITVKGVSVVPATKPLNVMLRGPRMGYIAYSILVAYKSVSMVQPSVDSLFGKNNYTFKLLKNCPNNSTSGFTYYEVSITKKNKLFIKMAWKSNNPGTWIISFDCNDEWSSHSIKTTCPVK